MVALVSSEIDIQRRIPDAHQGRLFAINESLPVLALSIGGVTHAVLGKAFIMSFAAASFFCFLLLALFQRGLSPRLKTPST
jgi:hypothetical protein